jgi:predicted DNA-binding transcriptional regulator AlpA
MPRTAKSAATGSPDALVAPPEVSGYLGIPEQTLANWRSAGKGPKWYKVGRHTRYRMSEVNSWLDAEREARDTSLAGVGNGRG